MDKASQLDAIFLPRTLAVIGVSAGDDKFGSRFLKALLDFGFKGRIFPVNPKGGEVFGLPIYRSLAEIPEPVESADIMVPARFVPQVLEECLAKGVKGVQIFSSGFSETGDPEGAALEKQLKEIASRGIRFIGPNCFGVYCPASGHTLLPGGDFPKESGPVAFISQSGGHAVEFAREAMGRGIRFSKAVSYGNACDVNEADLLEYMARDPETKVITMYLEGPREGRRFLELVRETAPKKPIVLWKAGLTPAGGRAVRSHTGSLGGEEAVWQALFKQTAAIRVGSLQELADTTQALLTLPADDGASHRDGGRRRRHERRGDGRLRQVGLEVPPFDEAMRRRLAEILPPAGTMMRNPVDVGVPIVPPDIFRRVLETVAAAECVDTLIATQPLFYILSGRFGPLMESEEFVQALVGVPAAVRDSSGKPVVVVLPVGGEEIEMTEVERAAGRRATGTWRWGFWRCRRLIGRCAPSPTSSATMRGSPRLPERAIAEAAVFDGTVVSQQRKGRGDDGAFIRSERQGRRGDGRIAGDRPRDCAGAGQLRRRRGGGEPQAGGPGHRRGGDQSARSQGGRHRDAHAQPRGHREAGGGNAGAVREDRHPGQQRGDEPLLRPAHRHRGADVGPDHDGEPEGILPAGAGGGQRDEGEGVGQHHQCSSRGGKKASPGLGCYSISKAGVIMLTQVLAQELGPYGIRVNAIAPAIVQTRFAEALWANDEILAASTQQTPLRRIAQPEEMAGVCVWLASDASSYVTGQTVVLDGGQSA